MLSLVKSFFGGGNVRTKYWRGAKTSQMSLAAQIEMLEARYLLTPITLTWEEQPSNADFFQEENWNPIHEPDADDSVVFDSSAPDGSPHQVEFFVFGNDGIYETSGNAWFKEGQVQLTFNNPAAPDDQYEWHLENLNGTSEFVVGDTANGSAVLNVAGGTIETERLVVASTESEGTLSVQDTDIDVDDGEVWIGKAGKGALELRGEVTFQSAQLYVGAFDDLESTVDIDGIDYFGVTDFIEVGSGGKALLRIQNINLLDGQYAEGGNFAVGGTDGRVEITNAEFNVGLTSVGENGQGTLQLETGAVLTTNDEAAYGLAVIGANSGSTGTVKLMDDAQWIVQEYDPDSQTSSRGTLRVGPSGTGTLQLDDTSSVDADVTVHSKGTLSGESQVEGHVTSEQGAKVSLGGNGGFGIVGQLSVGGQYDATAGGTIFTEIAGAADYDVLDVTGNVALGGVLDVSLVGYTPQLGDSFDVVTVGGVLSGEFDGLNLPALPSGLAWDIIYGPNVTLEVVAGPTASIVRDFNAQEDDSQDGQFTVLLDEPAPEDLSIQYSIGGTAANGTDYQTLTGTLLIPEGEEYGGIAVDPIDDGEEETDETVTLTLQPGIGYGINQGVDDEATLTIYDEDSLRTASIQWEADADEGGYGGAVDGEFSLSLSHPADETMWIDLDVTGTATEGSDYQSLPDSLQIEAGEYGGTIAVVPIDDAQEEPDETVEVEILDGDGYSPGADNEATLTIFDDDSQREASIAWDWDADEYGGGYGGQGQFTVALSHPADGPLTVTYSVGGTAGEGVDYQSLSGSVPFQQGESSKPIVITPIDDELVEGNEDVVLTLADGSGYVVGSPSANSLIIYDDDQALMAAGPPIAVGVLQVENLRRCRDERAPPFPQAVPLGHCRSLANTWLVSYRPSPSPSSRSRTRPSGFCPSSAGNG